MQENKPNFSPIKRRILQYLEFKGISKYQFYKNTSISRGTLDNDSGLTEENIAKFLAYYKDVNLYWLLRGEGEMLKSDSSGPEGQSAENVERYNHKSDTALESVRVPLYSIEAVAGVVEVFEHLTDTEPVAYIEIPNLPKCDGAVYMVGDSMYPLLKSGDIIIYKVLNNIQNILWGEMYLLSIVHDGDAYITVKYVKQSETPGYVTLVSYNEHHQPKDFPMDSIRFAGLIKASVRINCMG